MVPCAAYDRVMKDDDRSLSFDRQLLLAGTKRNAVLDLWEVERYGIDSFGDADYVALYGMRPAEWYAMGIRVLGRTAVECTRDALADAIGSDIAAVVRAARMASGAVVIDPFAGWGNTLHWILHALPGARGIGFESDVSVFALTSRNLSILELPIEVLHADYRAGLSNVVVAEDMLLIAFLAPPWGPALDTRGGLDLRRTTPPIIELVEVLADRFPNRLLCAIQVFENVEAVSLAEVAARFDWSNLRIIDLNAPGQNHGLLLATLRWTP